jgi:hypothetical protein
LVTEDNRFVGAVFLRRLQAGIPACSNCMSVVQYYVVLIRFTGEEVSWLKKIYG